jgi:amidase
MTDPVHYRSARQLRRALRAGRLRSIDLLEHYLARNTRFHPQLNAIIATDIVSARKRARAADRARANGQLWGPLHGLPITVKEAFDVAGYATTWGRTEYRRNIATTNAVAVQRLIDAGAIVFGKTNVPVGLADWQSFNPIYGVTNNPYDLTRTPGGSSGGSAAALAAGLTSLEIGSDIGGSIRSPAHCCGLYGHKPTYGLVSNAGHALPGHQAPLDLNVIGPLARSAGDLALALGVLAGPDGLQPGNWTLPLTRPTKKALREFRVGVLTQSPASPVDSRVEDAIQALTRFLRSQGAKVESASPALDSEEVASLYVKILRGATSALQFDEPGFVSALKTRAKLAPRDRGYFAEQLRGNTQYHREWMLAHNRRHALMQAWREYFERFDLLLCPAAPVVAFPHQHGGARWDRTVNVNGKARPTVEALFWAGYASLFYLPATVAPIARSVEGLPIGVQIIGPWGGDLQCIRFAELLEREYHRFAAPQGFD